jgi:MFS family permease
VTEVVELWMVVVIALLLGLVTAVDNPTRQTFTLEMVGRDRLTNAVSLNTATFTTARVMGPAIAGFLITWVGIGQCFLLNVISFVPIVFALVTMNPDELTRSMPIEQRRGQVLAGLRYVAQAPVLKTLLVIMAIVGTLQYNFQVILPVLARDTFDGNAADLGMLGAAIGIGMFIGSLTSATFGRPSHRLLLIAGASLGTFTLAVAAAPTQWAAMLLLVPLGASSMAFLATMNSTLQLTSSDEMRGRVMALYFVLFLGSTPIGAPIVGWVAEAFSPRASFALGGLATLVACAYGYLSLARLRPATAGIQAPEQEHVA